MSPRLRPDACSVQWDDSGLPAYGSAAVATFWVALEQNGPWGHNAIVESRLDPELGRRLERACAQAGGRLLLVRCPGAHPNAKDARPAVLVSGGPAASPWLVQGSVASAEDLLALPFDRLAEGGADLALDVVGGELAPPAFLVCTNGKRDVCCATRGRPVAAEAAAERPGRVWECSHTGGHRFAPTGVLLPTRQTLGRIDAPAVVAALDLAEDGRLVADVRQDRGLSHLDPVVQAAEAWARAESGLDDIGALIPGEPYADGPGVVVPLTGDGRESRLRVERGIDAGTPRRDSCAKEAVASSYWRVSPA